MLRQQRWTKSQNYKKYIAPIAIIAIIFILIIKMIISSWNVGKSTSTWSSMLVTPAEKAEAYIYLWEIKKQIEWATKFYSTDKEIRVESWEVTINKENTSSVIYLNKNWELAYKWDDAENSVFELINWETFIETKDIAYRFKLNLFEVQIPKQSVVMLYRTVVWNSIYVLKWEANLLINNKNIKVWVGQQLELTNFDKDVNVESKISPINDDLRWNNDFYIKHNWDYYLKSNSATWSWETLSWSWWTWSLSSDWLKKSILITYPEDEQTVNTNLIDIEGKIVSSRIEKVTINDKEALLNKEVKTFSLKWFKLASSVNNLVYKTYDKDSLLISKWVLTIYSSNSKQDDKEITPKVTNYPISSKDFSMTTPWENPYKTSEDFVKIEWKISKAWAVKYITVNDYKLTKFSVWWTSWYYFANKNWGTMKDGINNYEVKFFWENDELLYTQMVIIVREDKQQSDEKTQSWSSR